jgi:predicted Zn-dependent protease
MSFGYGYDDGGYRTAEPHRGPSLRMVAGLVIALIGIVIYMTRTEVNPVTGKKQHIALTVDQEKAMGLEAAPGMAAKMGGRLDPATDPRAREVAVVGRRVLLGSDAKQSPYVGNYNFYLLNDPETVNAFALPGGQVFITRGLYDQLDDEAELAGVLGHEIGHVVGRHAAEHMAQGQLGQILTVAFGVGASGGDDRGRKAAAVAAMVNQLAQLRFSREDESEADSFGLKYMAEAGFDPQAMLDVMKILKNASKGGRTPEFLATHPMPETRLEQIEAEIHDQYPDGVPADLTRGRSLKRASGEYGE